MERYLFLYLLTNQHQNSAGCYALPDGYACTDLGWPAKQYRAGIASLVASGMILVDERTSEVLLERWFRHNAPMNTNHYKGTAKLVARIQSDQLRGAASAALDAAWRDQIKRHETGRPLSPVEIQRMMRGEA